MWKYLLYFNVLKKSLTPATHLYGNIPITECIAKLEFNLVFEPIFLISGKQINKIKSLL